MDYKEIIYTKEEGVAVITLNRPQNLNALTDLMKQEWGQAIDDAKNDPHVNVLIFTGMGRAFCSGGNPRQLAARDDTGPLEPSWKRSHPVQDAVLELDKPLIGAVNGPAVGAGMDMASLCDLRIASDQARFGTGYVRLGLVSGEGGCYYLPRIIGLAKALELTFTGRVIDAQEALQIGYVNQVVPHEQLMPAALELARELARGASLAIRMSKRLTYQCLNLDPARALQAHEVYRIPVQASDDAKEGPKAWVEKRAPQFKGR